MKNEIARKFTIKEILRENWDEFVKSMAAEGKPIRLSIIKNVKRIIDCQDPKKGYALYICEKCSTFKQVYFTCKSRFCNTCGAKYSKDRALSISAKLIDCSHRHVVFTIPEELRKYFAHDRSLLDLLFEAAANTIFYCFGKRSKSENYIPGMISVLHTFGSDLKWNPHIHMVLCEEAVGNSGMWLKINHINYEGLRRSWQYSILKLLIEKIPGARFKALVDKLYADHKAGFYVNSPPLKNFSSGVVHYIVRYVGRPVLAQSRIINYDRESVSFIYTPHDSDEELVETLSVFDFIKRLIIHIPDYSFKMIRYFGFYNNKHFSHKQYMLRKKRITPSMLTKLRNVHKYWHSRIGFYFRYDPLRCSCGGHMTFVELFCSSRKINSLMDYAWVGS
jgi:hypothetical protein